MVTDMAVESEFPPSLGKVARRELAVNGITKYDQLVSRTPNGSRASLAALGELHPDLRRGLHHVP